MDCGKRGSRVVARDEGCRVLSLEQRDAFERTGLLRLPGAIPRADAMAMADKIWSFLAGQSGVDRNVPATWAMTRTAGFQPVSRSGDLDGMWSPTVCAAIEDLVGTRHVRRERPRVLMTFPGDPTRWTIP